MEPYAPFVIAMLVLAGLVAFELVGTVFGFSGLVDHGDAGGEVDAGPLDWLNPGRVPLSVLLILFLGLFSAAGFAVQALASAMFGPLPVLGAAAVAAGTALITTGETSRFVSKVMPRDESYVAHADDLIGSVGVVTLGPLGGAHVGRARVTDAHGNVHFPLVRPATPEDVIPEGAEVTLVSRQGREFFVVKGKVALDASKGIELEKPPSHE